MAKRIVINETRILAVVPLVDQEGHSDSMFVQPGSRAEIPPEYEIKEPYLRQHTRVRVVTVD